MIFVYPQIILLFDLGDSGMASIYTRSMKNILYAAHRQTDSQENNFYSFILFRAQAALQM